MVIPPDFLTYNNIDEQNIFNTAFPFFFVVALPPKILPHLGHFEISVISFFIIIRFIRTFFHGGRGFRQM